MAGPSCKLTIKAIPNAPRNAVVGWLGDALKVKVHAPALEGRANVELCEIIADTLGLPRRAESSSGEHQRAPLPPHASGGGDFIRQRSHTHS